jgi:hypothetical protein
VDGRCRAREIIDFINLDEERVGNVVPQKLKLLVTKYVLDVAACAGEKVVDAEDLAAALKEPLCEVRPEEARAAGNEDPSLEMHASQHS